MSNQVEYPEDNLVGKHEPHDLSLTRRDLIKVSAATAATAVIYPHSTLAASVPAATPAPEIMPLTLKVNGKTEQLEVDTRTTLLDALRENLHFDRYQERLRSRTVRSLYRAGQWSQA